MCVAVPGRVLAMGPGPEEALVQMGDRTLSALTLLVPEVAVGDAVLVMGGLIVSRLAPSEAEARRQLFAALLQAASGPQEAQGGG